jgi:hypothetical protein
MTQFIMKVELKQPSKAERKLEGLRKRKPNKVEYILQIEKLWEDYAFDRTETNLDKLVKTLKFTVKQKAEAMERRWINKRLSMADFESVFYEELWKLCDNYNHYGEFYFYETFLVAISKRGIDVTRKLTTRKGQFETSILPLKEETVEFIPDPRVNIEKDVINCDLVKRILTDRSLTEQEIGLLQAIYSNPETSNRELANELGFNHHEQVSRTLNKIKKKISYIFL